MAGAAGRVVAGAAGVGVKAFVGVAGAVGSTGVGAVGGGASSFCWVAASMLVPLSSRTTDEEVGRNGKEATGLTKAAQVCEDQEEEGTECHLYAPRQELRER